MTWLLASTARYGLCETVLQELLLRRLVRASGGKHVLLLWLGFARWLAFLRCEDAGALGKRPKLLVQVGKFSLVVFDVLVGIGRIVFSRHFGRGRDLDLEAASADVIGNLIAAQVRPRRLERQFIRRRDVAPLAADLVAIKFRRILQRLGFHQVADS